MEHIAFLSGSENHNRNVDSVMYCPMGHTIYMYGTADSASVYKIADLNLSRSRADSWMVKILTAAIVPLFNIRGRLMETSFLPVV